MRPGGKETQSSIIAAFLTKIGEGVKGFERAFVIWTIVYMAVYMVVFFTVISSVASRSGGQQIPFFLVPFHLLGMAQNLITLILTFRDLYLRKFQNENDKVTWTLLILMTGGIGWLVYIFKYALEPRPA
jgi:hypothetical protein